MNTAFGTDWPGTLRPGPGWGGVRRDLWVALPRAPRSSCFQASEGSALGQLLLLLFPPHTLFICLYKKSYSLVCTIHVSIQLPAQIILLRWFLFPPPSSNICQGRETVPLLPGPPADWKLLEGLAWVLSPLPAEQMNEKPQPCFLNMEVITEK